jgi:hypothetical protein
MEFGLAQYTSVEISQKNHLINSLSDDMKNFLYKKNYGSGIKSLFIGIICVSPNYEAFFKPRKPKYTDKKKKIKKDGIEYEIEKCLEYDIKLDYKSFSMASDSEVKKIIANGILKSLGVLDEIKLKINDFNTKMFRKDLEHFFKDQN